MNRREALLTAGGAVLGILGPSSKAPTLASQSEHEFSRGTVVQLAKNIAARPFKAPQEVPRPFGKLGYDEYRDIKFKRDRALWAGEDRGFAIELLHSGFIYKTPVQVHTVVEGKPKPVRYSSELFDFGPNLNVSPIEGEQLLSGFRLLAPINSISHYDEFAVFQGASYFRAVGAGQIYGASARGLAVDTGEPKGEEFPLFRSFWIEKPEGKSKTIFVHALLDSVSVAGAFTFRIRPGAVTEMDVQATLFARSDLDHLGLAPLTSMYLFDSLERSRFDDYRAAVHDSDTLAVHGKDSGWLVRPLANSKRLEVSSFSDSSIKGFGLEQRARRLSDYHDLEARYELRPSTWVEPRLGWGEGNVELIEIPSDREFNDNIVAFWRPPKRLAAGEELSYAYWLHWGQPVGERQLAWVTHTRGGLTLDQTRRHFVVDFSLPDLDSSREPKASSFGEAIVPRVSASKGTIKNVVGQIHTVEDGYRVTFELDVSGVDVSELRLRLTRGEETVSETWVYRWTA